MEDGIIIVGLMLRSSCAPLTSSMTCVLRNAVHLNYIAQRIVVT